MESDQVITRNRTDGGSEAVETERGRSKDVISQAVRNFSQQVKSQAISILTEEKNRITGQMEGIVNVLNEASEKLREQQNEPVARITKTGAEGIEKFASRIRQGDTGELVRQVEDFARQNPAVVAGVAMAAGFIIGQILSDYRGASRLRAREVRSRARSSLEYHPEESEEGYYERH